MKAKSTIGKIYVSTNAYLGVLKHFVILMRLGIVTNSSFGFSKGGLNHRARRMQSSLLELPSRSRICISSPAVGKKFQFTAGSFTEFIDQYYGRVIFALIRLRLACVTPK